METTPDEFRSHAPELLIMSLSFGRNALIDAPPGLGKTKSAAKAAIVLSENRGQRVLLLEPTKTLREQMVRYLKESGMHTQPHESKAYQDYKCPIIQANADPSLCMTRKNLCRQEGQGCGVLMDIDGIAESKITVATFAKFLLSKSSFSKYDSFIIDESHGFENAETTYLQTYLLISRIEDVAVKMKDTFPDVSEKLESIGAGLSQYREMIGDSTPLAVNEIITIGDALGDEKLKIAHLECSRNLTHPEFRALYNSISAVHYRAQNINDNIFFFYEGALYARPKNMNSEVAGFFRGKNVALLSATIDNAQLHAKACGIDLRRFQHSDWWIMENYPEARRRNRLLLALTDGPNLGRNEQTYESSRQAANTILYQMLKGFQLRTLVLFRSYSDHKSAYSFLANSEMSSRLLSIEQAEDPDTIDAKIQQFRGLNSVVLTTASSRLWEGVDIPGLRLVLIDALPYPGRDPLAKDYNFAVGRLTMIKKLKQGLGRIVRSDDDWGSAVILDRRFIREFKRFTSQLPWRMGEDFQKTTLSSAIERLNRFAESHGGIT